MVKFSLVNKFRNYIYWNYYPLYFTLYYFFKLKRNKYYCAVKNIDEEKLNSRTIEECKIEYKSTRNVLFAVCRYELSGAELYALHCIKKAKEEGANCFTLATDYHNSNSDKFRFEGLTRSCLTRKDFSELGFVPYIIEYIKLNEIDLIHIHHSLELYLALPEIRHNFPELKIIDTTHIVEYSDGGFPDLAAMYSDYINQHHVISKTLAVYISDRYHQLRKNSIENEKFILTYLNDIEEEKEVKKEATEHNRPLHVVFYGRFVFQKQPAIFIEVMKRIFKKNKEIRALICGEGCLEKEIKQRVDKSGYADRFTLLGRCDDKDKVLKKGDILFISSINEGVPLTAYEALRRGVKIIAFDVGANFELHNNICLIELGINVIHKSSCRVIAKLQN